MHRWTAMFLPPIRISIFEQDIAMLPYIKMCYMCEKFMKSMPVNLNPLAKRNQESWLWRILLTTEIRNPSSIDKESRIQLKESGILIKMWIQNPSSTDIDWNPVAGIRNPLRRIQTPRLSWIPLYGSKPIRFTENRDLKIQRRDRNKNVA